MDPNAYDPIPKRYKDQEHFVSTVQQQLVSPAVRSLKDIVEIIKPKSYGIKRRSSERARSLPTSTKSNKVTIVEDAILSPQNTKIKRLRSFETAKEE